MCVCVCVCVCVYIMYVFMYVCKGFCITGDVKFRIIESKYILFVSLFY